MALYLVTGGAGFIGSHIVHALVRRGDHVRVFDDFSSGRAENLTGIDVEVVRGSITDFELCRSACSGVHGIFHEAAQVSVPRSIEAPRESYEINVIGTLNLLEAARARAVKRFVFAASSAAYGNTEVLPKVETMTPEPLSPYASGKLAGEHLLRVYGELHGIRTVSLRYFNVFGPRQVDDSPYTGVIAIFARHILENRAPKIFGDGEQTRDLTYVDNVVVANLAAMEREVPLGAVVNIGGGERVSIRQLFAEMGRLLGSPLRPEHAPARAGDVMHSLASIERARAWLGYEPKIGWREGLAYTLAWYRERLARDGR